MSVGLADDGLGEYFAYFPFTVQGTTASMKLKRSTGEEV
jgi:hypothetical protein